jgi:YVTN family beta-propeller protein
MRNRTVIAALLLFGTACAAIRKGAPPVAPLGDAAEVHVYLLPLPQGNERLGFTVDAVSLRRADGDAVPLEVREREIRGAPSSGQVELARGRLAPGGYAGLELRITAARLGGGAESARLLVDPEPVRVDLELRLAPGRANVVWLALGPAPVQDEYAFAPRFSATVPPLTVPSLALYCTSGAGASVAAVDRNARLVTGIIPVHGEARGIVLDVDAARGYVTLFAADQIEVLDLAVGTPMTRVRLAAGDGPGDVAIAADGNLVVVNERSRTLSFVNPVSLGELSRVALGDEPTGLVLDRFRRRAFVANRGSATVTVVDTGNRAVVGTIGTDPEPLAVETSRDGSRLYVVARGSNDLASYALPTLAPLARSFIGLGATAVKVDPRTDLIYLSRGDERRIAVVEPITLQPLESIDVPAPVSRMAIWEAESTLFALMPDRGAIAVVDLTRRRVVAEVPVGPAPYALVVSGDTP